MWVPHDVRDQIVDFVRLVRGCGRRDRTPRRSEEVERIVKKIRQAWPQLRIILRANPGFCPDELICCLTGTFSSSRAVPASALIASKAPYQNRIKTLSAAGVGDAE